MLDEAQAKELQDTLREHERFLLSFQAQQAVLRGLNENSEQPYQKKIDKVREQIMILNRFL